MADDLDPALTGAAFDLANAGYAAMPDKERKDEDEAIGSDSTSLREAAERRSAQHSDVVIRQYTDENGEPAAGNEAVTLARAARDYAGVTAAERLVSENESSKELAARVDALRAETHANDPDATEFYGFEPPNSGNEQVSKEDERKTTHARADASSNRAPAQLDAEIEKAIQHPQVRLAIEEKVGEAEKARQSYLDGLAAATQIAQASFVGQFPELAGVAPEHIPAALERMSQQDPAKLARVQAMIASTEQLFARQGRESRRQAEVAQQNFRSFAHSEDARLESMLKGEPKETQRAVTAEIMASAKASGVEPAEFMRLFNSEPLMRNATFQRMMYDAGKYRLMMKARDVAAAKPLPRVQRPGTATTQSERESADLRALSSKLSTSGNIKDAVALYQARKSSKG
jgi:hypothetical protein